MQDLADPGVILLRAGRPVLVAPDTVAPLQLRRVVVAWKDTRECRLKADLIVAGAYGHTRLGEWIFGGVTNELLASSPVCCMLSH